MPEDLSGKRVAHFKVLSVLGQGGMGTVYEAADEKLGRTVALKVLPACCADDKGRSARFLREARAAAQITHPSIATVFEIGESDGHLFIAMERIEGHTLRHVLASGPLPVEQAVALARDIAGALAKAHAAGIVHRDLKPENVMLSADGGVKILDFGIAKALDDDRDYEGRSVWTTRDGMIVGTPGYMSPEQAAGKPCDQRADVFAFGLLLFEMLTGQSPFTGASPMERLASVLKDSPTPLPDVVSLPAELRELVMSCLAKSPDARPRDGAELRAHLDRLLPATRVVVHAATSEVDPMGRTLATPRSDAIPMPAAATDTGIAASPMPVVPPAAKRSWPRWLLVILVIAVVGRCAVKRLSDSDDGESRTARESRRARASKTGQAAAGELPPTVPCTSGGKAASCSEGFVPFCDPAHEQIACCASGLVPAGKDGECGCPPGGAVAGTVAAKSCDVRGTPPGLTPDIIKRTVRRELPRVKKCYQKALGENAKLEGRIVFALRVSFDGRVYSARIKESSFSSASAQACMLDLWKRVTFPPPGGAEGFELAYPVELAERDP